MHVQTARRMMAGRLGPVLLLVSSALSLGACASVHAREDAEARRLPALVGSWAFSPDAGSRPERDTTVWEIGADGRIRYAQVHRGRVRTLSYAHWWTDTRTLDGDSAARVMCVAARGGRGRQCGRVRIDSVTVGDGASRRRLTWDGTTARRRHWTFVERSHHP